MNAACGVNSLYHYGWSFQSVLAEEMQNLEALEEDWLPPRDSNPDNLLQRQVS
jgi:hypothetical protein